MAMTMECWPVGLFTAWLRAGAAPCILLLAHTPEGHCSLDGPGVLSICKRSDPGYLIHPTIPICLIWVPFGPAHLSGTNVPTVGQHPVLGQANLCLSLDYL